MLRVMLVEDEYVVREGIKSIDWASHGYEFVGEAPDGEMALPLMRNTHPDIVITDIKMPFMDGLELTRLIKKEAPDTEIVILSGYEEFEYAKEAISLGVAKYLSKPISSGELLRELDELKGQIEEKKNEREIALKYERDMADEKLKKRSDLFKKMVSGSSAAAILEEADELGIDLRASCYCVVLCCAYIQDKDQNRTWSEGQNLYERLGKWAETHRDVFELFNRELEGQAIVYKGNSSEELMQAIHTYSDEFQTIVKEFENVRYYAGIGSVVERLSELGKSFNSAQRQYAHRYFDMENRVVYESGNVLENGSENRSDGAPADPDPGVEFGQIDIRNLDNVRLVSYLKTGSGDEAGYFADEYLDATGEKTLESLMFRQYIVMNLYFITVDFLTDIGVEKDKVKAPDPGLDQARSIESMKAYFTELLTSAIHQRDSMSIDRYRDIIDKVEDYIREHYMDEELNLNTLAEHVGFSPNHLSTVYSTQKGITLNRFLIEYRLDKAKEALKCTSKKSSQIALEVGYRDPHYFSYMFKKLTGMTPTQYREQ